MGSITIQIERLATGTVRPGGNVIFDSVVYSTENISYNALTGVITFNEAGRYVLDWWIATQSVLGATGVVFAVNSSQGDVLEGNSPIKAGEVVGVSIIDVAAAPVTVTLSYIGAGTVYFPTTLPVKATLVVIQDDIVQGEIGPTGPTGSTGATEDTGPTGDTGPGVFVWGAEPTIIWADSSAPGPGTGTPSEPYSSLQAAINGATTSTFANTYGMRARCIVLIAANSAFDEDVVIPPARHVQLLGLGPWVLGDAALANFASSVTRNITIQTNAAAEDFYQSQGPAFQARPVTVIGTFDNGTSVSTHTNYTDGAIISGDIIFQNTDPVDPFGTIEFQLHNARVVGSIMQAAVDSHQGQLNTYIYNSRVNIINHVGLRIQRMVDSVSDGTITAAVYSHITNMAINGNVTIGAASGDVPPTGIFSSQFSTITWTGPLVLDTASNFYFVSSASILVGAKTILFSLA
ncbi:hypothetical protein [Cellulosilyticum sp. I15G10I2]|uniref:hypothetical protein n=1 Tax=Cellulosilyticum sp. I15G10I2 TaxID=1892843 RepID=UPI00085C1E45|nr:hypothetical protein [Cellulosilyticum sp. I15G10I2]